MILGMTLSTFTLFHVVLSLVGIATGLIVAYGLMTGKRFDSWTAIFLLFTVLTSLTGFLFPFTHLLPSHVVGILSLLMLQLPSSRVIPGALRVPGAGYMLSVPWSLFTSTVLSWSCRCSSKCLLCMHWLPKGMSRHS